MFVSKKKKIDKKEIATFYLANQGEMYVAEIGFYTNEMQCFFQ